LIILKNWIWNYGTACTLKLEQEFLNVDFGSSGKIKRFSYTIEDPKNFKPKNVTVSKSYGLNGFAYSQPLTPQIQSDIISLEKFSENMLSYINEYNKNNDKFCK
jgi:hypothetical protein